MELKIYQVDAFTDRVFHGNPAAVVPLETWLPNETLLNIAAENNLSETAFFVPTEKGFHLRWFTPTIEVDLCGHATLATAFVIFNHLDYERDTITFESQSGPLNVSRKTDKLTLDFPLWPHREISPDPRVTEIFGKEAIATYASKKLVAVYDDPAFIRQAKPDISRIAEIDEYQGVIITSAGEKPYDFISRNFAPQSGIPEDPVTGSAHCVLCPIWSERMNGQREFLAHQASARGGDLDCKLTDDRVYISGKAVLFMQGTFSI
ncbi:MAG: PhzF family phenazine biosynthesis protein [Pseudomonadota bacterium]